MTKRRRAADLRRRRRRAAARTVVVRLVLVPEDQCESPWHGLEVDELQRLAVGSWR